MKILLFRRLGKKEYSLLLFKTVVIELFKTSQILFPYR